MMFFLLIIVVVLLIGILSKLNKEDDTEEIDNGRK